MIGHLESGPRIDEHLGRRDLKNQDSNSEEIPVT